MIKNNSDKFDLIFTALTDLSSSVRTLKADVLKLRSESIIIHNEKMSLIHSELTENINENVNSNLNKIEKKVDDVLKVVSTEELLKKAQEVALNKRQSGTAASTLPEPSRVKKKSKLNLILWNSDPLSKLVSLTDFSRNLVVYIVLL